MGLTAPHYREEAAARAWLEAKLWPEGPICPHCGELDNATKLKREEGTDTHGRKGLYVCRGCRSQFTITVGTIFEDSHISLDKWLFALHLMCSSKKGVSALQLQREIWGESETEKDKTGKARILGSYRTAWFMCHRLRWAMTQTPVADLLKGAIEVDETYVGGKEKGRPGKPTPESKKTPVLALLERGGDVRSFPIERATLKNIKPILQTHVDPESHLVTDDSSVYYMMKPHFAQHSTINHSKKEYVRREANFKVTTNTVESFFALIKRSVYGIHHHMSRKYLGQYCAERDFVYNGRKLTDCQRFEKAVASVSGKRLMLKEPKGA